MGYSLQGTSKQKEGRQHVDRDAQFGYVNSTAGSFLAAGEPVISVDTKKKELVGEYSNAGKEYQPKVSRSAPWSTTSSTRTWKGHPVRRLRHGRQRGWVSVGRTPTRLASRWPDQAVVGADGATRYPEATKLLICADSGGSNGYRLRAWKVELAKLAKETGLEITVCHFPPGTSKWNKIEHGCSASSP